MWKSHTVADLTENFLSLIGNDDCVVFILSLDNQTVGFAQCQLRYEYVEGTHSSPVGYLEGIFVDKKYRKQGYAKLLLKECEQWAKEKGCSEFASDCKLENRVSLNFHLNAGFSEANRIICFYKKL